MSRSRFDSQTGFANAAMVNEREQPALGILEKPSNPDQFVFSTQQRREQGG